METAIVRLRHTIQLKYPCEKRKKIEWDHESTRFVCIRLPPGENIPPLIIYCEKMRTSTRWCGKSRLTGTRKSLSMPKRQICIVPIGAREID